MCKSPADPRQHSYTMLRTSGTATDFESLEPENSGIRTGIRTQDYNREHQQTTSEKVIA